MKYVILRCEDGAPAGGRTAGLLEGAKTSHLQQLAQAGAAGLIRPQARAGRGDALDRFHLHRTLFGLERSDAGAAAGRCYADAAGVTLEPGETAWGCELVTQRAVRKAHLRLADRQTETFQQVLPGALVEDVALHAHVAAAFAESA